MTSPPFQFSGMSMRNLAPLISPISVPANADNCDEEAEEVSWRCIVTAET